MSQPALTLYRLQACPFCERVVRLLEEYDLDYQSRFVEPMHSERDVVKRVSGKRTVPALVDEHTGVTLTESANIVSYLETTYGENRLRTPETTETEAEVLAASEGS
jgi:glutathione S-transferase